MFGMLKAFGALMFNGSSLFPPEEQNQDSASLPEQSNCTVLAIDDDPTYLETLRPLLREEGFNVLTCTSGAKALNMLQYRGEEIKVVLLDYNMPQLDGAETLNYLRQLNPQIKVVALTGVDIHLLPDSFHKGVDNFLQKPFRTKELVAAIRSLLGTEATAAEPSLS